jgi:hypothetical protein
MGLMDGPLEIGPAHGPLGLTGLAGLLRSLPEIDHPRPSSWHRQLSLTGTT